MKKTKGENERRGGKEWERKESERERAEPVDKGLRPPFLPLVIDLSSIVCKM